MPATTQKPTFSSQLFKILCLLSCQDMRRGLNTAKMIAALQPTTFHFCELSQANILNTECNCCLHENAHTEDKCRISEFRIADKFLNGVDHV